MADTKIKDLTSRTPVVGDQIPINVFASSLDGQVTVGAVLDIINGKVNVDSAGASTLSAASTDLSDTANITLLDTVQTVTGAKTFGSAGAVGKLKIAGTTSGSTIIDVSAVAGATTITIPSVTDTLVGKATTDTLTNKTLTSPTLTTPLLGTPSSGVLTSCTGLPLTTGVTGTLPVANGGTGVTSSTGTVAVVLSTSPTLVTPLLGTPTSGTLTNCTGLPVGGISATGGDATNFLKNDGTWAQPAGSGDMVLASVQTVTGAKTFGTIGGTVGKLIVAGSTSGSTIVNAAAVAGSTTMTLPTASATLIGKDTTDVLTNKSIDADGTGNVITNIENADIKAGAAIASSKLAGIFSFIIGNCAASTANVAEFYFCSAISNTTTTESDVTTTIDFPFTLRRITARVSANTKDGATVISFRDDGADTAGTLSIAAAATGTATTGAISNVVATGSVCNWDVTKIASTSGSITIGINGEISQP